MTVFSNELNVMNVKLKQYERTGLGGRRLGLRVINCIRLTQVLHMRRNLDQSEVAIAQVFEEKQRVWEREMDELRQNYAGRLQQVSRKALRSQHALQAQVARLQQDKRRLQDEITALLTHREELERRCLDYRKQQADIRPRLEETKWEVSVGGHTVT